MAFQNRFRFFGTTIAGSGSSLAQGAWGEGGVERVFFLDELGLGGAFQGG